MPEEPDPELEAFYDSLPASEVWRYLDEDHIEQRAVLKVVHTLVATGFLHEGRVIQRPKSNQWLSASEIPELSGAFAEWRAAITWRVQVGNEEYQGDARQIVRWINEGRVTRDTLLYNPAAGSWRRAADEPQLRNVQWPAARSGCLSLLTFGLR